MVKIRNKKVKGQRAPSGAEQLASLHEIAQTMIAGGNTEQALDVLFGVFARLQHDNERLTYRLAASTRARFGRRSEKLNAEELGQLVLAMGGTEEQAAAAEPVVPAPAAPTEIGEQGAGKTNEKKSKKHRPNPKGRTALNPDLPRDIKDVPVPEDERRCIHCGAEMECVGHIDHETEPRVSRSGRAGRCHVTLGCHHLPLAPGRSSSSSQRV